MAFDRAKLEDEYTKMQNISLEYPPDSMRDLYASALNYRAYAENIYMILTQTIYARFPTLINTVKEYSSPDTFDELEKMIENEKDERQIKDYNDIMKYQTSKFKFNAKEFNDELKLLVKTIQNNCDNIEKNIRSDLSSGAFFYGRIEQAMRVRGEQIEAMAKVIKDVYIVPITNL